MNIKQVINKIKNRGVTLFLENRKKLGYDDYGFPKNHAEILGCINTFDNFSYFKAVRIYRSF